MKENAKISGGEGFAILLTGINRAGKTTLGDILFETLLRVYSIGRSVPLALITGNDLRNEKPRAPRKYANTDLRVGGRKDSSPETLKRALLPVAKFVTEGGVAIIDYWARTIAHRGVFAEMFPRFVSVHLDTPPWAVWVARALLSTNKEAAQTIPRPQHNQLRREYRGYVEKYDDPQKTKEGHLRPHLVLRSWEQTIGKELTAVCKKIEQMGFIRTLPHNASGKSTQISAPPKVISPGEKLLSRLRNALAAKLRERLHGVQVPRGKKLIMLEGITVGVGITVKILIQFVEQIFFEGVKGEEGLAPMCTCKIICFLPYYAEKDDPSSFLAQVLTFNRPSAKLSHHFARDKDGQLLWCLEINNITEAGPDQNQLFKLLCLHISELRGLWAELMRGRYMGDITEQKEKLELRMLKMAKGLRTLEEELEHNALSPAKASERIATITRSLEERSTAKIE